MRDGELFCLGSVSEGIFQRGVLEEGVFQRGVSERGFVGWQVLPLMRRL